MLMLALRLFLKDKGGKQHCLIPFVGSNMGVETRKRGDIRKGCFKIEDWVTSVYFALCFQENSMQSLSAFKLFFGYKRNSKSFIFFHSLIIEFLWFAYGSNSRKRYTLRLKSPKSFDTLFDSLRWAPFSLALHLCSS